MAAPRVSIAALLIIASLIQSVSAATYQVGGSKGWTIPASATFYDEWAANQNFVVGDKLLFTYSTNHNVYEVSSTDATACDASQPLAMFTGASPTITLTKAGTHAFICEVLGHCVLGMKMTIDVAAVSTLVNSTVSPSTPTLGPSAAPSFSPPAPPPPSSAFGLRASAAFVFGAALAVVVPWIM